MKFLSVCSGIEAASVAWQPLGWKAAAFSEIEPFPCALLAHHYPDTPNLGDMTKYKDWPDDLSIDLLCGGTPCQSFSVAGLRKGLDDPRGNLMLTFGAIAAKYRPEWLVWENVPGVLSSNGGADFGAFLGMLGQLGYGFAYRVLDAQYFGVAQRRRRVFVVARLGDWRGPAAVLFERHGLQGHPAPRRETRQAIAGTLSSRTTGGGGLGTDFDLAGGLQAFGGNNTAGPIDIATAVRVHGTFHYDFESETFLAGTLQAGAKSAGSATQQDAESGMLVTTHTLRGEGFDASEDGTGRGTPLVPCIAFPERMSGTQCASAENLAPSMGAANPTAVAFSAKDYGGDATMELSPTLRAGNANKSHANSGNWMAIQQAMQVRRLTPGECESLQGFPQGYTAVPNRGKPAADGPRYKALGNSWAVPNVAWIGRRIEAVAAVLAAQKRAA